MYTETGIPSRPDELEHAVREDEDPSEHLLLVELDELVVVVVCAHVDDAVHVQVQVVDRRGVLRYASAKSRPEGTVAYEDDCKMRNIFQPKLKLAGSQATLGPPRPVPVYMLQRYPSFSSFFRRKRA